MVSHVQLILKIADIHDSSLSYIERQLVGGVIDSGVVFVSYRSKASVCLYMVNKGQA